MNLSAAMGIVLRDYRGLSVKAATKYTGCGIPLEDLVQIATIGAAQGLLKHEPTRGPVTAAVWLHALAAVRGAIRDQVHLVRLPRSAFDKVSKIRRDASRLEQRTGGPVDTDFVSYTTGESPESCAFAMNVSKPTSLDSPHPVSGSPMIDTLAAPEEFPEEDRALLREALGLLPKRERQIVLDSVVNDISLEEAGARFGLSRERARQIRQRALLRLRAYIEARHAGVPRQNARKRR